MTTTDGARHAIDGGESWPHPNSTETRPSMLATHPPHPSDGPPVRVHLTAATLDAAAAVCHVRGLPHLVLLLDRAAAEMRQQEGNES